jgi:hypothetical protein
LDWDSKLQQRPSLVLTLVRCRLSAATRSHACDCSSRQEVVSLDRHRRPSSDANDVQPFHWRSFHPWTNPVWQSHSRENDQDRHHPPRVPPLRQKVLQIREEVSVVGSSPKYLPNVSQTQEHGSSLLPSFPRRSRRRRHCWSMQAAFKEFVFSWLSHWDSFNNPNSHPLQRPPSVQEQGGSQGLPQVLDGNSQECLHFHPTLVSRELKRAREFRERIRKNTILSFTAASFLLVLRYNNSFMENLGVSALSIIGRSA